MIFTETKLAGAYLIEPELINDERGFFARTFCKKEFELHGLNPQLVQCNISFNRRKATVRGMHFQKPPSAEDKLIRCTAGAVLDVIIDLRRDSATFREHVAVELTASNRRMLYVPQGFAHGFQTLADDTEVSYQMSEFYAPERAGGVRWNDPAFRIQWPLEVSVMSGRDRNYADFSIQKTALDS